MMRMRAAGRVLRGFSRGALSHRFGLAIVLGYTSMLTACVAAPPGAEEAPAPIVVADTVTADSIVAATARVAAAAVRDSVAAALESSGLTADRARHPYQPGIDVLHYELTLELPERGRQIEGRAVLTVGRTAERDTLILDLLELRVDSVLVDGRPTVFGRSPGTIAVPLPRGRDTVEVTVRYGGAPADGLIITDSATRWAAFGDNWPNRARHWIPSVDHPSDKATVTWIVRAPTGRTIVANGALVERTVLPGGRTRTVWRASRPLSTYLMVIGAGALEEHALERAACGRTEFGECVEQAVYVFPELADYVPGPFAEADEIVDWLARLVAPFPYERLAHVQSLTRFGGMENATAIFYSDQAFRNRSLPVSLIAHEIAHQWFGDAVTEREWPHLWLSEGFATYFAQLWREHAQGDSAFQRAMAEMRDGLLAAPVVAARPVIDTAQTELMGLLNANSYQKGAWVLHMLRSVVGDSAFFAGIRDYYAAHRHGTALTDDLEAAMERASGRELRWFFDQWLRRPGYIEATWSWRYDPAAGRVLLQIQQGERFPPYRFPLVVELRSADGRTVRTAVDVPATRDTAVALPVALETAPASVIVDPDVELLARFTRQ